MFNQQKIITILSLLILLFIFLSANLRAENIYIGDMVLIKIFTKEKGDPKENFYIGKYEVTNKEYWQYDPGHKGKWSTPDFAVENVSWNNAVAYCKWLSNKTGKNYRLPTLSEWTYACRGGTSTDYYWGDSWWGVKGSPMYEIADSSCWYRNNSKEQVHTVGQKKPNAWGLYDMIGNVSEWCSDWREGHFSCYGYSSSSGYVIQGCSWNSYGTELGIYDMETHPRNGASDYRSDDVGFRIVRTP